MGFFTKALVRILSLTPASDRHSSQQPLPLSGITIEPEKGSPGFTCQYPSLKGWKSCNGPQSRDCWLKDSASKQPLFSQYDIHTDYESVFPQGIHREYWLNVTDKAKVLNGSYPGPLIEACWGDDITVHVTNYVKTNGSTIHWHGLRQFHTNEADGVNGVTQCPIAFGDTFDYNFKALQYGHTWYHSHYSLQYPDGVAGPLLIHGPSSANWDEAWDPILISDWSHRSAFQDFYVELGNVTSGVLGREPTMQSIVLNGTGNYICDPSTDRNCLPPKERKPIFSKVFEKGKRYLLRLVNSSTESAFVFTIDNHVLEVISTDLVPIHPFKTESIPFGIGQRYAVIVEAKPSAPVQKDGNYWIRTIVSDNCGNISQNNPEMGVIRYNARSTALPTSTNHTALSTVCADEPPENLVPVVPWPVDHQAVNDVLNDTFEAEVSRNETHGAFRWDLTDTPLWLNFSNPTILNLGNTTWNPEYAIIGENYDRGYVYLVITSELIRKDPTKGFTPAAHPIHLHGHDFVILAQSTGNYSVADTPKTFNFNNPPRRDVALLPAQPSGYLAIGFKADNPGVWLVHCHIAWHASSGLAMQILERQNDILPTIPSLDPTRKTCQGWDAWLASHISTFNQDDSGV
ncbi:hypothetical protein ABVK25_003598 [Lepraria finkii]|uniref:Laccase n=1 Tax=Lepraria finkii TaxID=1340010 RepID=A0ABR4BG03_9LECA